MKLLLPLDLCSSRGTFRFQTRRTLVCRSDKCRATLTCVCCPQTDVVNALTLLVAAFHVEAENDYRVACQSDWTNQRDADLYVDF